MIHLRPVVIVAFLICWLVVSPSRLLAWNDTGHETVALIAWDNMTAKARSRAIEIMKSAAADSDLADLLPATGGSDEARYRQFFKEAATWPDIVRDDEFPARKAKYHKRDWHFINYFWQAATGSNPAQVRNDPPLGLLTKKLKEFEGTIADVQTPASEVAVQLAWFLHLTGDIHQPLHCSARITGKEPEGDRGGNLFCLSPEIESVDAHGNKTIVCKNLHSYWDGILNSAAPGWSSSRWATELQTKFPKSKFGDLKPGDYETWAKKGRDLAIQHGYPATLDRNVEPPTDYKDIVIKVAEEAVALAGYRLAAALNALWPE